MAIKRLLCIGDSVSGGLFSTSPEYTYQNQMLIQLRKAYPEHEWHNLVPAPAGSHAYMGGIWNLWNTYKYMRPDIVVLGGVGDNDGSSTVSSITTGISNSAKQITFNSAPTSGRAYILSDGTNEEVVIPQGVSSTNGTMCIRGAMGTTPRAWNANSAVLSWSDRSGAAWSKILSYIVTDIATSQQPWKPIVLIGGQVFEASTDAGSASTALLIGHLQQQGYLGVEYCSYLTADGTELFTNGVTTDYCGPAALLTTTLGYNGYTLSVDRPRDIDPNDYIMLTNTTKYGLPLQADSQVMKVNSKTGNYVVVDSDRPKLGSTGSVHAQTFGIGARVCKMSTTSMYPRDYWDTIGGSGTGLAGGYNAGHWGYDRHPNNMGYIEIANSFVRGLQRAIARVGL